MLQNKLHVFCCPFYRSFSLVCIVSLVFKLQFLSRIMKIFDYRFSVSPFILSRYGVFCNWSLSTSVSFRNKSIVSPECTNYIGGFGGMFHRKRKKKMKIGLSETTYPAFPGSNAIRLFCWAFSSQSRYSIIIPVHCFQSHFKVKEIVSYSTWSHSSSSANQSAF